MRSHTLLCLLVLLLVASASAVRYHSLRYGLSFEYNEDDWTFADHPNTAEEKSNAFTLRSVKSDRQIVLGHHLYHKSANHDVRTFDELFRKANPTGVDFKLTHQVTFDLNGLEAHFVAGTAPRTDFCNVHVAHGRIVWYVWTNIGFQPENSSLYEDYFALVRSLRFDENAPSTLNHRDIYGSSYAAINFDENHPALQVNSGYKVSFSDVPTNENKKRHRMARDCYSQCYPGGWNFGPQGSPTWCWCCNNNCGGYQSACAQQGWPGNCGGSNNNNNNNNNNGAFAGWSSPLPGAWIWCGSGYHTGNAQWAADAQGPAGGAVSALVGCGVNWAGWDNTGYGNVVLLNSGSYYMAHCHLTSIYTSSGSVYQGQTVGTIGGTGGNYYPHLHFHIRTSSGAVNLNQLPKFTDPNGQWPTSGTNSGGANCARFAY
eukprot:TRINITY_DN3650_c0_g2_i1.p1 TRINITY_DN3650_c0_g2~~TRINITY_DN3650_c0_g2_i1.p1  ORF type:complete len:429 (+),score=89.46 TRINITY_DN3650_c0_g2_i1:248-1534(+)